MAFRALKRTRQRQMPELHHAKEAGAYLTDGTRLFRVIAPLFSTREPGIAVLEDCVTLDACVYTADELWAMGLTLVRPVDEPDRHPAVCVEPVIR